MPTFQRTETVILDLTITNAAGTLSDPSTSVKLTVYDSAGSAQVNAQDHTKDATGKYHYDWTPGTAVPTGRCHVRHTATNGSRVTILDDYFDLEA